MLDEVVQIQLRMGPQSIRFWTVLPNRDVIQDPGSEFLHTESSVKKSPDPDTQQRM